MRRRRPISLLSALICILLFVAVPTMAHFGDQDKHITLDTVKAFEQAHPNVTVNYVDVPYDSLLQKLTTGAAGGELPDLVRSDIIWVPKFAALGVFAQLDGKMPNFDALSQAVYPGTDLCARVGKRWTHPLRRLKVKP